MLLNVTFNEEIEGPIPFKKLGYNFKFIPCLTCLIFISPATIELIDLIP
jgi:hypothetical protein